MPRNGSGTYSLPSGNPVEAGTVIEATWANTTLQDIGNELTNSLSRTGAGGMLAPFRLADGTVSAPGVAWLNEPSTGMYRATSGEMWNVVGGQQIVRYTSNGMLIPTGKTLTAQDNVTIGGTLAVTGAITATGGIVGNATNVTGTVAVANGGTGATTAANARTNLGATTVGANFFTLTNPGAITFPQINADNTVTAQSAASFRSAIGAGTGNGDVTGPGSATDNAVALFNGAGGKTIKNSALTFDGSTLQASSTTAFYPQFVQVNKTNDTSAAYVVLDKDRGGSVVQNNDVLGNLIFRGYGGTSYHQAAAIMAKVNGTPGNNDMPGALSFLTTPDGSASPVERMTISNAGTVAITSRLDVPVIGMTSEYSNSSAASVAIAWSNGNRQSLTLNQTTTITFSFTGCPVGTYQLKLVQDGTGGRTVNWSTGTPGSSNWVGSVGAPALNSAASSVTFVSVYWDGTNAYGSMGRVNSV